MPALARLMPPHNTVMRMKNRRTAGCVENQSGIGKKSVASLAASGLPAGADRRKAPARSTVPRVGCRK